MRSLPLCWQVYVKVGDEVKKGSVLMTVEGMKMEVCFSRDELETSCQYWF